MNIRKKILAVAVLAAISSSAFAAEKQAELSVFGSIQSTTPDVGSSTDTTLINFRLGMYLSDQLLWTFSDLLMASTTPGQPDTAMNILGLGVKYYLNVGKKGDFVPFVDAGLNLGSMESGSFLATITGFEGGVGASYFLSETASVDGRFSLASQTVTPDTGPSSSQTMTTFAVGVTQRF